jgi:hypothetical protein
MQYYQMKLLTFKKKAIASLMKVIKTMFIIDTRMVIEQFHSKNDEPKDDQPICCFEDLPEMEEELAAYFPLVYDKKNKDGTSIVFRLSTKHSHVEWKKRCTEPQGVPWSA